jgi:hypothetical protein
MSGTDEHGKDTRVAIYYVLTQMMGAGVKIPRLGALVCRRTLQTVRMLVLSSVIRADRQHMRGESGGVRVNNEIVFSSY